MSLKNNSLKVKNKTENTLIKWDTQRSEELVLTRKILILTKCSLKLDIFKQLLNYYNEKQWAN